MFLIVDHKTNNGVIITMRTFLILLIAIATQSCVRNYISKEEIIKTMQETSLNGNLLQNVDSSGIELNKFQKNFKPYYLGDFNKDHKQDMLCAINVNYGCHYQFLVFDYKKEKRVFEVKKINGECGFYSYLTPSKEKNRFEIHYLENDTIKLKEVYFYNGFFIENDLLNNNFEVKKVEIEFNHFGNRNFWVFDKNIAKDRQQVYLNDLSKIDLENLMYFFDKIDFKKLKENDVDFFDAPKIAINLYYEDGSKINFEDAINIFTGKSQYNSLALSNVYSILFQKYMQKDF